MDVANEVKAALDAHEKNLEKSIEKFEGQLKDAGSVATETRDAVKSLSEKHVELTARLNDIEQKGVKLHAPAPVQSLGQQFVKSDEYAAFQKGQTQKARVELKNTVLADSTTTTTPQYQPGVVAGAFRPLTINDVLPQYQTSTDLVVLTREASFTNNAAPQTEGAAKAQSAITFNKYNVPVETVAHWLKVSKQLMADAPAVVSYIENRLRFGVDAKVDDQLLNGNGTSPNISGLLDSGNYTVYTPTSGDTLIDAINRAKYQLWAIGYIPDAVIVNPADWGGQEVAKGTDGHYLYGMPGMVSGMNPFGVRVVISPQMPAGQFLIGKFAQATGVWNRESTVVEMGYENDDFTKNLVTLRAERRLGLEVSVPAALLGGEWAVSASS